MGANQTAEESQLRGEFAVTYGESQPWGRQVSCRCTEAGPRSEQLDTRSAAGALVVELRSHVCGQEGGKQTASSRGAGRLQPDVSCFVLDGRAGPRPTRRGVDASTAAHRLAQVQRGGSYWSRPPVLQGCAHAVRGGKVSSKVGNRLAQRRASGEAVGRYTAVSWRHVSEAKCPHRMGRRGSWRAAAAGGWGECRPPQFM